MEGYKKYKWDDRNKKLKIWEYRENRKLASTLFALFCRELYKKYDNPFTVNMKLPTAAGLTDWRTGKRNSSNLRQDSKKAYFSKCLTIPLMKITLRHLNSVSST